MYIYVFAISFYYFRHFYFIVFGVFIFVFSAYQLRVRKGLFKVRKVTGSNPLPFEVE